MSLSSRENIIEIRCNPGHVRMYKLKMTASEPDQEVSPRHINRWWNVIINSVSELSWLMDEGNDYWKISYDRNYRLFWPIFDSKNSTLILNHHINEDNHHVLCIFSRYRMSSMPHKTHSWRGNCLFILLQIVSINVEHMLRACKSFTLFKFSYQRQKQHTRLIWNFSWHHTSRPHGRISITFRNSSSRMKFSKWICHK